MGGQFCKTQKSSSSPPIVDHAEYPTTVSGSLGGRLHYSALSRCICCELSRLRCHGHSLLLSSYLHRIRGMENSACSACGHPLQDLNHLLLDCPASQPLCKSIFGSSLFSIYGPDLGVWPDCWVSAPPSLGRGRVVPPPTPRTGKGEGAMTQCPP